MLMYTPCAIAQSQQTHSTHTHTHARTRTHARTHATHAHKSASACTRSQQKTAQRENVQVHRELAAPKQVDEHFVPGFDVRELQLCAEFEGVKVARVWI